MSSTNPGSELWTTLFGRYCGMLMYALLILASLVAHLVKGASYILLHDTAQHVLETMLKISPKEKLHTVNRGGT